MPFINIKTSFTLSSSKKDCIKSSLGKLISLIPGKSEDWLMVGFDDKEENLYFNGNSHPCCMIDVCVYGELPSSKILDEFTSKVTDIISKNTDIESKRIYIKYSSTNNWGWNGSNF